MTDTIAQIRSLLNDLETETGSTAEAAAIRAFSGLELPDIIRDVVDLLMPEIRPYEAAIYIHFFATA